MQGKVLKFLDELGPRVCKNEIYDLSNFFKQTCDFFALFCCFFLFQNK